MNVLDCFQHTAYYQTRHGASVLGDSLSLMKQIPEKTVNLVMTSPPFALKRKKEYGNVDAQDYIAWFLPFAEQMKRIITDDGSIVVDIGGTWNKGVPSRSLYHFKLAIALVEELGLHLAQEFYWYNPAKLPSPAEWVTVRRLRVKDAVNMVWWLSKSPFPKANNRNILKPYSDSMKDLLANGYNAKKRPSGHDISTKFQQDNGGAIPPNLIELANTDSNGNYLRSCRNAGIKPHPARFPHGLPEFFVKFLTVEGDLVLDPFAGSVVVGEVSENLHRQWLAFEIEEDYLKASKFRFSGAAFQIPLPLDQTIIVERTSPPNDLRANSPIRHRRPRHAGKNSPSAVYRRSAARKTARSIFQHSAYDVAQRQDRRTSHLYDPHRPRRKKANPVLRRIQHARASGR